MKRNKQKLKINQDVDSVVVIHVPSEYVSKSYTDFFSKHYIQHENKDFHSSLSKSIKLLI